MNRRAFFLGVSLAAITRPGVAHTPYGQWVVYRKKHLLIGAHRAEPETYAVAKRLAASLAEHLPKSKCRVARAPTAERLASLLGTDQLDVAVLNVQDALTMRAGTDNFAPYGPIALTLLATTGAHLLVAHSRLPARHAWLVTATLQDTGAVDKPPAGQTPALDWHPGAQRFHNGEPVPTGD